MGAPRRVDRAARAAIPANYQRPGTGSVKAAYTDTDRALSASALARIDGSTPNNTQRCYAGQWERYSAWCAAQGRVAVPTTSETIAEYVAHLADLDRAPATITQALAAIRALHREAGAQLPDSAMARKILRGHRRNRTQKGLRTRQAPPITIEILRLMVATCDLNTVVGQRDRVLLVIGWTLMGRRSELAALNLNDVTETLDGLEILIRYSKTDQDGIGAVVAIPGGAHEDTDPVRVIREWRAVLAQRGITSGKLLRSVRGYQIGPEINPRVLWKIVKRIAVRAKIPNAQAFSTHSLRAGGATSAYKAGVPVAVIAEHGRWAPNSPVVLSYIRASDKWKDNAMRDIGL